jgi:hypothetical protein
MDAFPWSIMCILQTFSHWVLTNYSAAIINLILQMNEFLLEEIQECSQGPPGSK